MERAKNIPLTPGLLCIIVKPRPGGNTDNLGKVVTLRQYIGSVRKDERWHCPAGKLQKWDHDGRDVWFCEGDFLITHRSGEKRRHNTGCIDAHRLMPIPPEEKHTTTTEHKEITA